MPESSSIITFRSIRLVLSMALIVLYLPCDCEPCACAVEDPAFHFRCEAADLNQDRHIRAVGVRWTEVSPGGLTTPAAVPNIGSWQFDGHAAIAYAVPSNTNGFAENFTWEGFFLSSASNTFLPETGIADRLVTQFAFDKGDWTRLAIGLVADKAGAPRLSVELEGFDGRSFGLGDRTVTADRWHHFALVHEGTAAAARIRWYLDYQLTGELFLGGQSDQNTLRPPGRAPLAIGARLSSDNKVNRGFQGFIDEVRLIPRPLSVDEFLRCGNSAFATTIKTTHLHTQQRDAFWEDRHRWARDQAARWAGERQRVWSIDALFANSAPPIDDASFLRRLSLTVRGHIPTLEEVTAFMADDRADKRTLAIDQMLASPEWGDGWVGYWQDVLAENPSVVFPTLNNSGAFRQWLYESFRDNKPFDRFATELILMEHCGTDGTGDEGPAGFALATGNDAPLAMRAHVALKAFAAIDLKCARCHDSPIDDFRQADLFLLAAYLHGGPVTVPGTSLAAVGKANQAGAIATSLVAGQEIPPAALRFRWLDEHTDAAALKPVQPGSRAELAALITSPRNSRFSDVIVNRLWQRYFSSGLVEPVDQWNGRPASEHSELLRRLSNQLIASGYDLKAVARLVLCSDAWQSRRAAAPADVG